MFIRRCWYVAAWSHELAPGELIARTIINEPLVLYRTQDGEAVALEDRCCHRFAPLSAGRLEGDDVRCMYHGLKFNRRGTCIEIPGQSCIAPHTRVRAFPVIEQHGWLWVWMGEPALADQTLVPPVIGPDDPNWILRTGQMDYEAHYLLINDNLTDFTHLSYVHSKSFGASEEFAQRLPTISRVPRGIRVQRWLTRSIGDSGTMLDEDRTTPLHEAEQWQSYDYLAPGILRMYSGFFPAGTAERLGYREPPPDEGHAFGENFTSQAVTPLTATTSRYFFAWGPRVGEGTPERADLMMKVALIAFAEDRAIIERQQKIINSDPTRRELLTNADLGPTQMRRVIEELIAAEAPSLPDTATTSRERSATL